MERLVEFVSGLITEMEKSLNGLHRISLAVLFAIKVGVWVISMMGITLRTSVVATGEWIISAWKPMAGLLL